MGWCLECFINEPKGKWLMSKTSSFLNCCSECCSFQISKYQLHIDLNSFYQIFRIIDCLQDKVETSKLFLSLCKRISVWDSGHLIMFNNLFDYVTLLALIYSSFFFSILINWNVILIVWMSGVVQQLFPTGNWLYRFPPPLPSRGKATI